MPKLHTPKPDLLAGSGDCPDYKPKLTTPYRYRKNNGPITRPHSVKASDSPSARKRSLTMSEIQRNISPKRQPIPKRIELENSTSAEETLIQMEKNVARKVYTRFLLNAWRSKREQANTYEQSIHLLEDHVYQLQLQTTFLRNLRESESVRRTEASIESRKLQTELEEKTVECQKATEEKEAYEVVTRNLEITVNRLQNEVNRTKNEAAACHRDVHDLTLQLERESEKRHNLNNDRQNLLEKITRMEEVGIQQQMSVDRLREIAEDLEKKLQEKTSLVQTANKHRQDALDNLNVEKSKIQRLEHDFRQAKRMEKKLRSHLQTVEERVLVLEDSNLSLKLDCASLKATVLKTEESLTEATNRAWWKTPACHLYNVAIELLPALPDHLLL